MNSKILIAACMVWSISVPVLHAQTRTETDLLGEKQVPDDAYYGVQTMRALENFQVSNTTTMTYPDYVKAWAIVKLAAAQANADVGRMPKEKLVAIEQACNAVMNGEYHDQFIVDLYQGGAGTSANMNANEVLANIALEKSGHKKGEYQFIEPHDDLNMGQSTNDSYPTAIKVALILQNEKLIKSAQELAAAFHKKGDEFKDILKMGRTEGQDAVPMTVGQEFHAFANQIDAEIAFLKQAETHLYEENMGATAIGTGITATPGYAEKCATRLAELTGKPMVLSKDLIAATSSQQSFVIYSSALKSLAITLSKISSDLIFLASGPRAGIYEINLPALQPGSSIMPGKVNPVMPELMNVVCFRVIGNDLTVTMAAHSGLLQLNAYEPVEAIAMFESQQVLFKTMPLFKTQCIEGITVNKDVQAMYMDRSIGIVTALNPVLGYEKTTELAKESLESGKGVLELIREQKLLTNDQIKELMDPQKMTNQK